MEEISGPIMAITLVLCAVFVPCAFISGITGRFFTQFAVTIAASTVISAINALTMTPSRALMIFKTKEGARRITSPRRCRGGFSACSGWSRCAAAQLTCAGLLATAARFPAMRTTRSVAALGSDRA